MKKIITCFSVLITVFSLNGCFSLDTYPGDSLNQSLFWKTEEHAKQGMIGVYGIMRHPNAFGGHFLFDHCADIAVGYNQMSQFPDGTYNERDGAVQNRWRGLYEGVQSANHVIRQVSAMTVLDDETKAAYVAEAKFLRAFFYFSLLDLFGGVPYYDETINVNADYEKMMHPRETADQIRSYIISDLNEAIATLHVAWDETNYGRATKGAAYALRGKVYLYNKEWKKAIADFEEIVYDQSYNYGYGLEPDYAELFRLWGAKKSVEMIFAIHNKGGVGNPYGMPIQLCMGSRNSYGWCWNNTVPSTVLVDMYDCPDGRPFDWEAVFPGWNATATANGERSALRQACLSVELENGRIIGLRNADTAKILNVYKNRDPRLMASVIVPYSTYKGWYANRPVDHLFALDHLIQGNEAAGTMHNNVANWFTYFYRKFVEPYDMEGHLTDREHSPVTYPLIRYADVLLMLAEAYNEEGQLDKAITEFNKVRARPSVNMPGLNSGPVWMTVTTKEQMTAWIRKDRALEFAGEGLRFSDLRRWGWDVASQALSEVERVTIYGDLLYKHRFTQRDMLWPIPAVEIEVNPSLKQNPGW